MAKLEIHPFSSPEEQFIVRCLETELSADVKLSLPSEPLDWERVYTILEQNKLVTYFAILMQNVPSPFPEEICSRMKHAYYALSLYGDQCKLQVQQVLHAMTSASIPVIVLKGWALIQWLYSGDHGQRYCEDIDILVPPDSVTRSEEVLRDLDYQPLREIEPGYQKKYSNAQAYQKLDPVGKQPIATQRFLIGFHWGLTHYPYFDRNRININDLFDRAVPLKVAGETVLELCPEDEFIYTCAHLALHHRNEETLLQFFEAASILMRSKGSINWDAILTRSKQWGYFLQVCYVIDVISALWNQVIPGEIISKFEKVPVKWKDRWIDKLVSSTKGNRFKSTLVEILALPGLKPKISTTFHQVFPADDYLQYRYGTNQKIPRTRWERIRGAIIGLFKSHREIRSPE